MTRSSPYDVLPYDVDSLKTILSQKSSACIETINNKLHCIFFEEYFREIGACTIVIENSYVDRDFLDDFMGYYVSCFKKYYSNCTRLHFFCNSFLKEDFDHLLSGQLSTITEEQLQSSYLGFIVVKPLPKTIIGRTCLKTYAENNRRHFSVNRDYQVNLFGVPLNVQSLAFQEQDHVVSACATSAIWSIFQGTGFLYQHPILSPVDITKIACQNLPIENRFFPNDGLFVPQMAQVIRSVGLEPYLVKPQTEEVFKSSLYAYLHDGIPALLGFALADTSSLKGSSTAAQYRGNHAVAVTGYSLGHASTTPYSGTGFCLKASRIDRIYVHDDQIGPFSRMIFDNIHIPLLINGEKVTATSLSTSWRGKDGKIGSMRAYPDIILVPLYHKIRIPFDTVEEIIVCFDAFIEKFRATKLINLDERLEWDIFLTTNNKFKSSILHSKGLRHDKKLNILKEQMPRFIWRAIAYCKDNSILELLFDATDIEQSFFMLNAIGYDEVFFNTLVGISKSPAFSQKTSQEWKILEWFSKVT
jgi:hypothetical protein